MQLMAPMQPMRKPMAPMQPMAPRPPMAPRLPMALMQPMPDAADAACAADARCRPCSRCRLCSGCRRQRSRCRQCRSRRQSQSRWPRGGRVGRGGAAVGALAPTCVATPRPPPGTVDRWYVNTYTVRPHSNHHLLTPMGWQHHCGECIPPMSLRGQRHNRVCERIPISCLP